MAELKFTDQNFEEEVLKSEVPVLVDFWAVWCGPCQMLGPVMEGLAEEVKDVKVGKLNVDENRAIAGKYGIMSIPTVILFKDGEVVQTLVGVRSKQDYLNVIEATR